MATVAEVEVESTGGAQSSSYEQANLQTEDNFSGRVDLMEDLQNFRFQNNSSNIPSLQVAETLFKQGVDAVHSHKYEDGVEFLGKALRIRAQHYGEFALECGTTYLELGRALHFNATVYTISQMYDDSESSDEEEDDDELSSSSGSSLADTEPSSGTPADNEGLHCPRCQSAMEEENLDLALAWEMLNTARMIFEKDEKANFFNIADAGRILGDIYLKRGDLHRALKEYTKALTIFEGIVNPDSTHIASLLYEMCFALAIRERVEEALNYGRRAVKVFECWLYRVENEVQRTEAELPIRAYDSSPTTPKNLALTAHEQDLKDRKGEFGQKLIILKEMIQELEQIIENEKELTRVSTSTLNDVIDSFPPPHPVASNRSNGIATQLYVAGRGIKRLTTPLPFPDGAERLKRVCRNEDLLCQKAVLQ